jgi:hypothetical protein
MQASFGFVFFISWLRVGFCKLLVPEYEELAGRLRRMVTVSYFDTEAGGQVPSLLGKISGTPTLKYVLPDKKGEEVDGAGLQRGTHGGRDGVLRPGAHA